MIHTDHFTVVDKTVYFDADGGFAAPWSDFENWLNNNGLTAQFRADWERFCDDPDTERAHVAIIERYAQEAIGEAQTLELGL